MQQAPVCSPGLRCAYLLVDSALAFCMLGNSTVSIHSTLSHASILIASIQFIDLFTDDNRIHIGHDPESETSDIQTARYVDEKTGHSVMLIDTPGLDDSREGVTDTDILEKIMRFLEGCARICFPFVSRPSDHLGLADNDGSPMGSYTCTASQILGSAAFRARISGCSIRSVVTITSKMFALSPRTGTVRAKRRVTIGRRPCGSGHSSLSSMLKRACVVIKIPWSPLERSCRSSFCSSQSRCRSRRSWKPG